MWVSVIIKYMLIMWLLIWLIFYLGLQNLKIVFYGMITEDRDCKCVCFEFDRYRYFMLFIFLVNLEYQSKLLKMLKDEDWVYECNNRYIVFDRHMQRALNNPNKVALTFTNPKAKIIYDFSNILKIIQEFFMEKLNREFVYGDNNCPQLFLPVAGLSVSSSLLLNIRQRRPSIALSDSTLTVSSSENVNVLSNNNIRVEQLSFEFENVTDQTTHPSEAVVSLIDSDQTTHPAASVSGVNLKTLRKLNILFD